MRIGFSIILNGNHHLMHNNYAEYLLRECLDYWVVIEGATKSEGSTNWCKKIPENYHNNYRSIDSTIETLETLKNKYSNLIFKKRDNIWSSKDQMVNQALNDIKETLNINKCFLWQIDIDEQWTKTQMELSENELNVNNGKTGMFKCFQFVGKNLYADGDWGGNNFIRLWNWEGEMFKTHEPPIIIPNNGKTVLLSQKFKHYSYFFENDVKFKDLYYTNHDGVYKNWQKINNLPENKFPIHITELFPKFNKKMKSNIHLYE